LFKECGDHKEAVRNQWIRRPAGPGSRAEFVELIRRYWLACDTVNQNVSADVAVAPESFLLAWLASDAPDDVAVKVIACLPYWPMGMDSDHRWT
jgi:hypothetical protein